MELLIIWLLSTVALLVAAWLVPGISVQNATTALIAAAVFGLANATIGFILKIMLLPLTILTLGLAHLAVNGLMLMLAAKIVPGFRVNGCLPALLGALVVSIVNILLRRIVL